jgi:hypothetical protein
MKRALPIAVAVALLAGGSAPAKPFHSLLGIVNASGEARLVGLDQETLAVAGGPSVTLGKQGGSWGFSPDRSHFVYAEQARLRFFDLFTFTPEGDIRLPGRGPVAWLSSGAVVGVSRDGKDAVRVVKVDAFSHAVLSQQRFAGVVLAARTLPDGLVVLLGRENKIVPVRVLVVESGRTRVVRLGGVWGGTVIPRRSRPVVTMRRPALALDEARGIAYVADPDGMIVELPLDTLQATSRMLHGGFAKEVHGSERTAFMLGDGLLVLTGRDFDPSGGRVAGLELVDTHTWSSRLVEEGAAFAWASADGVLATGSSWDAKGRKQTAIGLVAFDRSGRMRFRLFDGLSAFVQTVVGSRAYVAVSGEREAVVVDLAAGREVGRRAYPLPTPLLGRSSSD